MDAFTAAYLANLTTELTTYLIKGAGRRGRHFLKGTEQHEALTRSIRAGLVALLTTASAQSPEETNLLADIFNTFFTGEEVGEAVGQELADLLRGRPLDREELAGPEAMDKADQLQQAVKRGDLWGLARRPLLLTVMTLLHTFRGKLPEDRTELYDDVVDLLLRRWEQRVAGEASLLELLGIPGLKMSDLKAGLYEVGFRAHSAPGTVAGAAADVDEGDLRKWLAPYLAGDWNKAGDFVAYIRERAGLLVRHKTEAYTFPHRTFQEFMAACHLVVGVSDYPNEAARLVRAEPDRWREVFILAAGHAARTLRLGQAASLSFGGDRAHTNRPAPWVRPWGGTFRGMYVTSQKIGET